MEKEQRGSYKLFMGFGILAILSGIFLVIDGDYLIGISGSMVGALLVYQNLAIIRNQNNEDTTNP